MDQKTLNAMRGNWPPKTLNPFIDVGWSMRTNTVAAKNSPYQGRKIIVYETSFIESFIRGYAFALASDKLRKAQHHIRKKVSVELLTCWEWTRKP